MVIDTSAIAAILFNEPERASFNQKIGFDDTRLISAATLVEITLVVEARKGELGRSQLDLFVYEAGLDIVPFDAVQADLARLAWRTYGKGRHPAGLNLGDCFSYALAKATGEPLLFKGKDFSQTDITPC
jgi:ribonuclease VapC